MKRPRMAYRPVVPHPFATPLVWYSLMANAVNKSMSEDDLAELDAWERDFVDGSGFWTGSDWPGWGRFIDLDMFWPWPSDAEEPERRRREKAHIPVELRWQVWERDDFTCQECGTRRNLSVDHAIPESKGGATVLENLQTLCKPCNTRKGARL